MGRTIWNCFQDCVSKVESWLEHLSASHTYTDGIQMNDQLNIISCLQGSAEWFESRIGMLTASRIGDAIRKSKRETNSELKARYDLKVELAVERITGKPAEHVVTSWMERGRELEPLARAAYELRTGQEVTQVGFVLHPTIEWAGCSPDGLVGDGLVEFKCPKPSTHANYLLGEVVPELYVPQMMWQMACCPGYEWCDFVSYCPDFPEPLDLFVCRLPYSPETISAMEFEAQAFLREVDDLVVRLKGGLQGALEESVKRARA